jgi:hypothetical protein
MTVMSPIITFERTKHSKVKVKGKKGPQKNLRRYHYKIFFPENTPDMIVEFFGQFKIVQTTYHAAEQLIVDKRTIIPLPSKEDLLNHSNTLVEFYEILDDNSVCTGKIQKALIRTSSMDADFDFSYVISREGFMISAWATDRDDIHRLTDSANYYYCPEVLKEQKMHDLKVAAYEFEVSRRQKVIV